MASTRRPLLRATLVAVATRPIPAERIPCPMSDQPSDLQKRVPPQYAQAVELTTATYDRIAAVYAERNDDMPAHWRERMEQFVEMLEENETRQPIPELGRPGDDIDLNEYVNFVPVLDAGCGPGRDARALADYGLPVLGVDLSQGMLDEAGARTPRRLRSGAIRYALMDLRRLDLPDKSCRGVWCSASLLHIPVRTAPRAMAELARVTRPGGPVAIFLKARREDDPAEQMEDYDGATEEGVRRFFARYTEEEARILVAGSGLQIQDVVCVPDARRPESAGWVSLLARMG